MSVLDRVLSKTQKARIPFWMHLDLTYRCHQRCLHCYIPEAWRQGEGPGPELTTDQVKNLLDQLAATGTFLLALSGGEVFLRPDLTAILEHARKQNFAISLMTSGTQGVSRDTLRFLAELGLNGLLLTLFSLDPTVHDHLTGTPGSWARLWGTIREAKAAGAPVVLNCIAMRPNAGQVKAVRDFAGKEGIPLRLDTELSPRWDGVPHAPDLTLDPEEQENLYREVGLGQEPGHSRERATTAWNLDARRCGAGENSGYITPSGELWPCIEIPWSCGRLQGEAEFPSLWKQAAPLRKVREMQAKGELMDTRLCDAIRSLEK
jgi:MoaA/NifB/PqqE/SkfB family radical SAM enzyme